MSTLRWHKKSSQRFDKVGGIHPQRTVNICLVSIHLVNIEIFHSTSERFDLLTLQGQWLLKVRGLRPLGSMIIRAEFCCNLSAWPRVVQMTSRELLHSTVAKNSSVEFLGHPRNKSRSYYL